MAKQDTQEIKEISERERVVAPAQPTRTPIQQNLVIVRSRRGKRRPRHLYRARECGGRHIPPICRLAYFDSTRPDLPEIGVTSRSSRSKRLQHRGLSGGKRKASLSSTTSRTSFRSLSTTHLTFSHLPHLPRKACQQGLLRLYSLRKRLFVFQTGQTAHFSVPSGEHTTSSTHMSGQG